jgi:hypothetical protein
MRTALPPIPNRSGHKIADATRAPARGLTVAKLGRNSAFSGEQRAAMQAAETASAVMSLRLNRFVDSDNHQLRV